MASWPATHCHASVAMAPFYPTSAAMTWLVTLGATPKRSNAELGGVRLRAGCVDGRCKPVIPSVNASFGNGNSKDLQEME